MSESNHNDEMVMLAVFASKTMRAWPNEDIDGGELQGLAEECGLLVRVTAYGPCGRYCQCEYKSKLFPTTCWRRSDLLKRIDRIASGSNVVLQEFVES